MNEDFEAAPMSPLFVNPITTIEIKVLCNMIVFSKNLGHYLFFEVSNPFCMNIRSWIFSSTKKRNQIWLHAEFH